MSRDVPIVLTTASRSRGRDGDQQPQRLQQLHSLSPATFNLNLCEGIGDSGGIGGIGGVRVVEAPQSASTVGLNLPTNLARLFMLTQVLTVAVLTFLIVAMLYVSYRVNSNANYYYYAAEPYLNELANHSMSIMRHADNSSAHFETIMSNGEELAAGSAPALLDSVNATTAMVSHFQELVQNPTIRLSLG